MSYLQESQFLDEEGYGWVVEGGDVSCAILQAASPKAGKSIMTSVKDTNSTNDKDMNPWQTKRVCVCLLLQYL